MNNYMILLIIIVLCFGLILTNPTREDFKFYMEDTVSDMVRAELEGSGIGILEELLAGAAASLTSNSASIIVDRDNYHLFSIYNLNILEEEYKYLGILKTFIPLPYIGVSFL